MTKPVSYTMAKSLNYGKCQISIFSFKYKQIFPYVEDEEGKKKLVLLLQLASATRPPAKFESFD